MTVGLVGGLGPESTIDYYRRILDRWQQLAPGTAPSIVIDSVDVQRALHLVATDRRALTEYLLDSIRRLAGAGAAFVAITANTPHIVFDDLVTRSPVPLLSIVEVAAAEARRRHLSRVAVLGTRFTMEAPFYPAVLWRHGVEVVPIQPAERDWIHACYVGELLKGRFHDADRERFIAFVARLKDELEIDGVVLAGTELPLLLRAETLAGLPALDTTELHVSSIVTRLLAFPRIRKGTAADAALLAAIGAETFSDTFAADNTAADMALYLGQAFTPATQAAELAAEDSAFLVAELDGTEVGYARVTWSPAPGAITGQRPLDVARLYVRQPWIGRGVGAALMRACLAEARLRGCDVVWLGVWEHNHRARRFYEKWGFRVVGDQQFVLGTDPQRDLLMMRPVLP